MHKISSFETGGVIESVNTATRIVKSLQFELFHDFNSNDNA